MTIELYLNGESIRIEVRNRLDGETVLSVYTGDVLRLAVVTRRTED